MARSEDMFDPVDPPGFRDGVRFGARAFAFAFRAAPGLITGLGGLILLIALGPALAAWIAKEIVDTVLAAVETGDRADRQAALVWVAAEAGVLGGLIVLRRVTDFLRKILHATLGYAVARSIFEKTLSFDLATIERADVQQQIMLAKQHASARPYGLVNRMFEAGQHLVSLIAFSALLWTFSPWAVAIIIAGGLPLFLGELRFSDQAFRFYVGRTPQMRRRTYLEGLMTSDGAAAERLHAGSGGAVMSRYRALFEGIFRADRALNARRTAIGSALIAVSSAVFLGGKAWVVWATVMGAITLGQMTMFAALLKQGQNTVTALLASLSGGYEDLLYVSNLYALLDRPATRAPGGAMAGPDPQDGYRLENVRFDYPGGRRPALDGIDLHIPRGIRLGIVGANGSGKTTLVKLLTGLYAPTKGRITLDGLDMAAWSPPALFARTAVLFQPFQRYHLTAGENIAMGLGLADSDPEAIARAAEAGLARPVIEELPEGYETRLSRQFLDGHELSGGQWQRLALARAMLRSQADTLILDEPTSALDPAAEAEFIDAVARTGRTVILISHRLSNLRNADRILVLDKGRIIEDGVHAELLEADGAYAAMFKAQAGFYRGE